VCLCCVVRVVRGSVVRGGACLDIGE
jgi:hypothetical protein